MIFRFYLGLIKLIKYNLCKFVLQLHIFVTNVPYHNNKCHVFLFCLSSVLLSDSTLLLSLVLSFYFCIYASFFHRSGKDWFNFLNEREGFFKLSVGA